MRGKTLKRALLLSLLCALSVSAPRGLLAQCPNPIDNPPADFFVTQQYRDFLFRDPTPIELANGVAPINSCWHRGDQACAHRERIRLSRSFWDHPEFRQQSRTFGLGLANPPHLYDNYDFVALSYWIYLQRAPDTPGLNFWLNDLNTCTGPEDGGARNVSGCYDHIIDAFLSSIEYRARFGCT